MVRKISFTFFNIHIDRVLSHGLTGSNPFLYESQDNFDVHRKSKYFS